MRYHVSPPGFRQAERRGEEIQRIEFEGESCTTSITDKDDSTLTLTVTRTSDGAVIEEDIPKVWV